MKDLNLVNQNKEELIMKIDIFKSVNSDFMNVTFGNIFSDKKIHKIKIEKVSPDWAKTTCLTKYQILFENNEKMIIRGSARIHGSKESVFQIMEYLYENDLNLVSKPLSYVREANLLLYEEAPGDPLISLIIKNENIKQALVKAAEWLTILHKIPVKSFLPKAEYSGIKEYQKTLNKIKEGIPEIKNYSLDKKYLNLLNKAWTSSKKSIIHNDFYPGNFIIGKNTFYGIDFDRSGIGPFLTDVAGLYSFFEFPKEIWKPTIKDEERIFFKNFLLEEYCSLNNLNLSKTREEMKPFVIKSFLDQLNYFVNFYLEGKEDMSSSQKKDYINKSKSLLITISKL